MKSIESKTDSKDDPAASDSQVDGARREAIGKIGKFAAYTAPAMLAMLASEKKAHADSLP
jgi:hypothetical protein